MSLLISKGNLQPVYPFTVHGLQLTVGKNLNPLGCIPRGLPRIRHTGEETVSQSSFVIASSRQ